MKLISRAPKAVKEPRVKLRLPAWAHWLSLPLAFASYLLLDVTLRYLFDGAATVPAAAFPPWLFSSMWALILVCIAALLPHLWRRIWLGVTFVIFALECVAHAALYKLTGTVFSFAALNYAGDGAKFFSFAYLNIHSTEWVWLAVCLVLMLLAILLSPKREKGARAPLLPALFIFAAALVILMEQRSLYIDVTRDYLTWDAERQDANYAESYSRVERTNDCFFVSGLYEFTFRSASAALFPSNLINKEEHSSLDAYYSEHAKTSDSPYAGVLRDDNLIIVLMESVDTWMLTPEYMPNLYEVMQEGVSFSNYYAPIYIAAATFNSEFSVNTGLAAPPVGVSNEAYTKYSFPYSLPHLFAQKGCAVNSFHVGSPDVYNRGLVHENLGFERYWSASDMGIKNMFLDSELVRAHDSYAPDGKFYSYLLTYSCHGPHNGEMWGAVEPHLAEADEAIDFDSIEFPNKLDREEYRYAVSQAMETDAFIGAFMEQLRADGRAENTTVIFLTDHYAKYMTDADFVMALKNAPNRDLLTRVPFIIWSAKLEPEVVDTPVSLIDVAPTVASLFDHDVDPRYYLGSDMFASDAGLVPFAEGHWFDGTVYYDGRDYYRVIVRSDEEDDERGEDEPLDAAAPPDLVLQKQGRPPAGAAEKTAEVEQRMSIAWRTFQSNYFAYLEEKTNS